MKKTINTYEVKFQSDSGFDFIYVDDIDIIHAIKRAKVIFFEEVCKRPFTFAEVVFIMKIDEKESIEEENDEQ